MKNFFNVVSLTLYACVLLLLLCVFHATTETNYTVVFYALLLGAVLGFLSIVCHLLLSFTRLAQARHRLLHLGLAALLFIIVSWVIPKSVERHFLGLRRAFLQKRVYDYEGMVASVKRNQRLLSRSYTDIGYLVGRRNVMARTNEDGSFDIRFHGRGDGGWLDHPRVGYYYHDGPMVPKPDNTNYYSLPGLRAYDYHLTNGWYEF